MLTLRTPMGRAQRRQAIRHGAALVRNKIEDLDAAGITRVSRVVGVRDGRPITEDGPEGHAQHLVHAVISPAAAHRRVDGTAATLISRLADHPGATPAQRLDHVETILFDDSVPLVPQLIPGAFAGLAMFGLAARLLRSSTRPVDLRVTLKGLPHNITTEMDLELCL